MCGFAGFSYRNDILIKRMGNTLRARAVDAEKLYLDNNLSFYHAHLKISDLDKNTSQPFIYKDYII